jgi:hypothetical protein
MTTTATPRYHSRGGGGSAARCCSTSWMLILIVLFVCEGGVAFSRPLWSSSLGRTARGGRPTASTLMLIDRPAAFDQTRQRRSGAALTRTTRSAPSTTTTTTATNRHRSASEMALQQLRGGGGGTVAVVATFNRFVQYIGQNRSRCLLILGAAIVLESCATGLSKRAKDTGSVSTFLVAACLNICWYVNTTSQRARLGHFYRLVQSLVSSLMMRTVGQPATTSATNNDQCC